MGRCLVLVSFLISLSATAAPPAITYEGYLTDSSDTPITSTVSLQFRIYGTSSSNTGSTNCLLYTETQPSISVNNGNFAALIGKGSGSFSGGLTVLDQIFDNQATIAGSSCSFAAAAGDARRMLEVVVNGTSMGSIEMSSAARALQANNSTTLSGHPAADFVQTTAVPTCSGGMVLTFSGSSFSCVSPGGGGITTLNGLAGSPQTFATPTASGTSMAWTSAGSSHTLNIPMASTTGVSAGLLSKADYDTFNNKIGTSTGFSGDVSGTVGAISVDKIKGTSLSISAPSSGQALKYNGSNWTNSAITIGDVTSLSSTLSTKLDASVSQSANTVLAAPNGAAGAPSFRALVAADLPASGYDSTYFKNGTNNFGAASSIGNQGSYDLTIKTSNQPRITIQSGGNVGIGTTSPGYILDVSGTSGARIKDVSSDTPSLTLENTNRIWEIFSSAAYSNAFGIYDATAGQNRMVIDTSGNLGIATTTPGSKLDVNGVATVNASTESIASYTNSGVAYTIPDAGTNLRRITLTGNATVTLPTYNQFGKVWTLTVIVKQDGTGSRTLTWALPGSDSILWDQSASAPPPNPTANKITIYQFTKPGDELVWYGSVVWKQN